MKICLTRKKYIQNIPYAVFKYHIKMCSHPCPPPTPIHNILIDKPQKEKKRNAQVAVNEAEIRTTTKVIKLKKKKKI